jgi:hypothetical protein
MDLSQMHPVHNFPPYIPKTCYNIILQFASRSSEWSLPFSLTDQNFVCISHLCVCYMSHQSYPPRFYYPNIISSILGPDIFLSMYLCVSERD